MIHGGAVALANWPAISSTPSTVTPSRLIRTRPLATAITAARCTVSQEVSKMRAASCHERRLANWPQTRRRPLSSTASRRPTAGSRPWACRNAGRPRGARRRPIESASQAPARPGSGASQSGCSWRPGGRRRSRPVCGRSSRGCAVPWWNVFGPGRAGVPTDPARSGRMPPSAPRGAGDLGTCASKVSGLRPQPCQPLEGSAPQNPRGIPQAWSARCSGGGCQVKGRTLASPPRATIGHQCSLFLARLPPRQSRASASAALLV